MSTNNTPKPVLEAVRITETDDDIEVFPVWRGVDRPETSGWALPKTRTGRILAARLARAITEGSAFTGVSFATDTGGDSYVSAPHAFLGRTMNADLTRLGY